MYRGTVVWALNRLASLVDDRNSNGTLALLIGSTTSKSRRTRAVDALNEAQHAVFFDLLDSDVARETLSREVALSAVTGDTLSLRMPPRAIEILGVRDSGMDTDDMPYPALSGSDYGDYGYTIGPRGETIKFHGFSPESTKTYYARVIEEPVMLAYGGFLKAETASTTGMLGDTAEYGMLMLDEDDLNGCELYIESATTGKGTHRTITDMSSSGSTTSITVDAAWTFTSDAKWSTQMTLPNPATRLVLLRAAVELAHWTMPHRVDALQERYDKAWNSALQANQRMAGDAYSRTRIVRTF